jgi:quinoprotein glucose dehydrogenase
MRASWAAIILAILMAIIGIALTIGGLWLVALGGSVYYLIAGVAMLASAWLLFRGRLLGGWIYIGLFILSAIWGFAESRGNAWAMVPWLVAPLVILIFTLLVMPTLTPREGRSWGFAWAGIALGVIFVGASFAILGTTGGTAVAALPSQSSPGFTDPSGVTTGADWTAYGGTNAAWRFTPLTQITRDNVGKLRKVWEVHTGGMPANADYQKLYGTENTPLKVGNLLYTCTATNQIIALDAATGKPVWRVDPHVPYKWIPYTTACRGVSYYAVPGAAPNTACASRIIEGTMDSRLLEVDALTGKPCVEFNGTGQQDTKIGMGWVPPGSAGINSAPPVVKGIIVVGHQILDGQCRCAPSGVMQGFDAKTGKLAWAWDMQHPDWNGYPPKGQSWAPGTPNSWTTSAADEKLGLVYVPTGNVADDYISKGRTPGENAYSSSIVAIDVTTGKPRWSFQTVKKDVWDYDIGSQPSLIEYHGTPALLVASKQGDLYFRDRATGKPLAPIGTIQAPPGGIEPGERSPTQIMSLWNTLRKPDLRESDMWGMSPIDQMICRIQYRTADYRGFYTPPRADKFTVEYPGYNGGSDWGSLSIDPVRGVAIANYNDMPNYVKLVSRKTANAKGIVPRFATSTPPSKPHQIDPQWGVPYAVNVNAGWRMPFTKLMCKRPPYGGIRAIDIGTGKTLWDRPFGTARANGPFNLPTLLPFRIGTPNNGGAVTTASGLIFIAASTDNLLRAIDERTGKMLWSVPLPAGGQATPMVYEQNGREYLVIFAGGHHFMETPMGDSLIAYALPGNA